MGPKIVSLVSSFRSTQVVRPTGKQTRSGVCTGPGVGSAGEGCLGGLPSGDEGTFEFHIGASFCYSRKL